ncbi:3-oxoacyl-ACP reductase family protein [Saccharopolyspora sp. 5N708]|uniref:3-oxoacyl-ACP reductase family protein n=1 Tax=Saccharopolyspora sp. 5N708 TaxID=3457424 RepID=UPI003FD4F007
MANPLSGKTALVTGGSRGIGAAVARRLAADGATVALTYASSRDKADEVVSGIQAANGRAVAIHADSANHDDVAAAVTETVRTFGGLDILVNNAGVGAVQPVDELSMDDIDRLIDVNVRGVVVAIREALKHLSDGGRIITIGSINADRIPIAGLSVYGMTKAAVAGLTRGLARELAPRGITVNNVQPGPIDTDLNPATGPLAASMLSVMALDRYGTSDEVAAMVSYLAGPEAAFMTGASLNIDGGYTA